MTASRGLRHHWGVALPVLPVNRRTAAEAERRAAKPFRCLLCGETDQERFEGTHGSHKRCRNCRNAESLRQSLERAIPLDLPQCDRQRGGCGLKYHDIQGGLCPMCWAEVNRPARVILAACPRRQRVLVVGAPHGTRAGYDLWECRCDDCRAERAARYQAGRSRRLQRVVAVA